MNSIPKRMLVVGATGGSGRATVERLLSLGHEVTAFSRHADELRNGRDSLKTVSGDVQDQEAVDAAVEGQDAVVVTLGITENPLRVRLFGTAGTPMDVRSKGTSNVISAMKKRGVTRLVVQTSYGVGETRDRLRFVDRALFRLVLHPQIRDTEAQELEVRVSGLEWVLVQPVHLTDRPTDDPPFVSLEGETRRMEVSRGQVARFLTAAAESPEYVGKSVAVSG